MSLQSLSFGQLWAQAVDLIDMMSCTRHFCGVQERKGELVATFFDASLPLYMDMDADAVHSALKGLEENPRGPRYTEQQLLEYQRALEALSSSVI